MSQGETQPDSSAQIHSHTDRNGSRPRRSRGVLRYRGPGSPGDTRGRGRGGGGSRGGRGRGGRRSDLQCLDAAVQRRGGGGRGAVRRGKTCEQNQPGAAGPHEDRPPGLAALSGHSVGHAAVSPPLVHPGPGDGEGSAALLLRPPPPANPAGSHRGPDRATTLPHPNNPRGHDVGEAGYVQETQRHVAERRRQRVSDLPSRPESRSRRHHRAAVHTHLPQRVHRGVAVEETLLSYVSRPGVHATARLLELHQGQGPLKPPGDHHVIRLYQNLKSSL